jgi:hypothetical protein
MDISLLDRFTGSTKDLFFFGLIATCLLLALGSVATDLEKRELLQHAGGARKIDLTSVKKQISEGTLSPHKALFFKRLSP